MLKKLRQFFTTKLKFAFSPAELMIMLVTVSVIATSMTPVVTKRINAQKQIAINQSQVTINCQTNFSEFCTHCTESKCLNCTRQCKGHERLDVENCECISCDTKYANCKNCDDNKCTKCKEGYYLARVVGKNPVCTICPVGHYCDGLNKMKCPEGSFADVEGLYKCKKCNPKSDNTAYYCPNEGASSQTICPAGSYCPEENDSRPIDCPIGTYSGTGQKKCTPCPAGTSTSSTKDDKNPQTGLSACVKCKAGYYAPKTGNTVCKPAPAGSYVASEGQSTFTRCSAGKYQDLTAQSSCKPCEGPNVSGIGQTQCTKCPNGFIVGSGRDHCASVGQGYWSDGTTKVDCGCGYICPGESCTIFPPTYSNTSETATPVASKNDCTGKTTRKACKAGTYTNGSTTAYECLTCPQGHYCPSEATCTATGCACGTKCPAGSEKEIDCAPGEYSAAKSATCSKCGCGTYSTTKRTCTCTKCAKGYYQGSEGKTSCVAADIDKYVGSEGSCSQASCCSSGTCCTKWTAHKRAQSACVNLPVSAIKPDTYCAPGTYSSAADCECHKCPAGTYQDLNGQGTCKKCPAGYYCPNAGMSAPTICPKGYKCPTTGLSAATICPCGTYQNETGKTSCKECAAGKYNPDTGRTTACDASCGSGQCSYKGACSCSWVHDLSGYGCGYWSGTGAACGTSDVYACPAGYQCSGHSKDICPKGKYAAAGSCSCSCCPKGKYTSEAGKSSCSSCWAGSYQSSTCGTGCSTCSCGTYSSTGASSCSYCPAGTYSSEGASGCTSCSTYYVAENAGSCSCHTCGAPNYASDKKTCSPCPKGYKCIGGAHDKVQCPAGTYSPGYDSKCTPCGDYLVSGPGAGICGCCGYNESPRSNHTGCDPCPGGYACDSPCSAIRKCAAGSYSAAGAPTCLTCVGDNYCPNAGMSSPYTCNKKACNSSSTSTSCTVGCNKTTTYSCPSGQSLSGTKCQKYKTSDCTNCGSSYGGGATNIGCKSCWVTMGNATATTACPGSCGGGGGR